MGIYQTLILFIVRSDFFYFIFVRPNGRTYICAALQGYQTIRVGRVTLQIISSQ